jgi:50S ribosomal subunit-associated GTPase HflX
MTRLQRIERKIGRLRAQLEKLEDERYALIPRREPDTFSKLMAGTFNKV